MSNPIKQPSDPLVVAAEIVAAFVAKNSLAAAELTPLIHSVHAALVKIVNATPSLAAEPAVSAASIRKSITPDYLVCLEDGRKFKTLRRHLANLGMTPDDYRAKWNLPADYPMVAPNYAARRSDLAKRIGLGDYNRKAGPQKLEEPFQAIVETTDL